MRTRPLFVLALVGLIWSLVGSDVSAATAFASPAFDQRWRQDEQITPNFWGPLALAQPGMNEPYGGGNPCTPTPYPDLCTNIAQPPQRLVQYFDKGRMELNSDGSVTSGLLAKEMITGQMQTGPASFVPRAAAAIPVAGDLDNFFPLYKDLMVPLPPQRTAVGAAVSTELTPAGPQAAMNIPADASAAIASTDTATSLPVPRVFAEYRSRLAAEVVGYAITPPFWVQVKVRGVSQRVLMQAFERRVLTYNAANPEPFQVEFGNVGQHYYRWRYGG